MRLYRLVCGLSLPRESGSVLSCGPPQPWSERTRSSIGRNLKDKPSITLSGSRRKLAAVRKGRTPKNLLEDLTRLQAQEGFRGLAYRAAFETAGPWRPRLPHFLLHPYPTGP